jgi:putative oxidoreductase
MTNRLFSTSDDWTLTIVRATLGVVMFAHGAQKMLGWFGGYGFNGTMGYFTAQMGIPALFAFLAIAAEFFGALGLIVGLLTRIAAFGIACLMAVAIAMVHSQVGFFMNWNATQKGEGFEYHLLVLAITLMLMVRGAGAWSIDRLISGRAASEGSHHHLPVHA